MTCCPHCGTHIDEPTLDWASKVAAQFHTNMGELRSPTRAGNVVNARKAIIKDMRTRGKSFPQIGRFLGMDHTTVIYHWRRMEREAA